LSIACRCGFRTTEWRRNGGAVSGFEADSFRNAVNQKTRAEKMPQRSTLLQRAVNRSRIRLRSHTLRRTGEYP
jgi:hypothetical protein